jgi:hypothetical protein
MDYKYFKTAGGVEIVDPNLEGILDSSERRVATRDEGEMAFYGKEPQLKVSFRDTTAPDTGKAN